MRANTPSPRRAPHGALGLVIALTSTLTVLSPALAQERAASTDASGIDEEARIHFELGRRYYATGRFAEAREEFLRAYELSNRTELLYNVYVAARDEGNDVHAAEALRAYVALQPEGEARDGLEARLAVLEERIRAAEAARTEAPAVETTEEAPAVEESTDDAPARGPDAAPWIVAGSGGALLAGSLMTGLYAMGAQSALDSMCPELRACVDGYERTRDEGQALAITTDVLWGTGAALAVTGVVWGIIDVASGGGASHEDSPTVAVACGADGCSVIAGGRL